MKNLAFALLSLAIVFLSCQKDISPPIDYVALQKKMDADPDVAKTRNLFHQHCRIIASLTPQELADIFAKVHSCGFYTADASIPELEKCLAEDPNGERYVTGEKFFREYVEAKKIVEQKFPELMQLEIKRRSEMLFPVDLARAKEVLSDMSTKNKK